MANLSTSTWGQEQVLQDHASILAWAQKAMALQTVFSLVPENLPSAPATIAFVNPHLHQLIIRPPAGAPDYDFATLPPMAIAAKGEHWQFESSLLAARARFLKIALPAKIDIINQRFAYRFELQDKNCAATFTNYTTLSFTREQIYQQASILDLSCTGLALKILPDDASIIHLQDQLIFSFMGNQEIKQKIAGEVVHIIPVNPWPQHPYFKVGVRFTRPLAMAELSTYINPGVRV